MSVETENKVDDIEIILSSLRKANSTGQSKTVRRDVANKTIFRIIRRFYLSLLEKAVPDYKHQKKNNMMNMLTSFADFLFPGTIYSSEIAQVMSCLMFRRELLLSKNPITKDSDLKVFLDIQSKYSHKLLSPALNNIYFKVMFQYFLDNGIEFFENDENVAKNLPSYSREFTKIKNLFMVTQQTIA